jgi:hypothetical protein
MSAKTVAAFLAGALAASTGTAVAVTSGHVFRLQEGDEAQYHKVTCQAIHVPPYSAFRCYGVPRYSIEYGPSEITVLRSAVKNPYKQVEVFTARPSGR